MSVIKVTDLDLKGKRVFIRADLNVPVKDGKVTSDARITASMATINYCLEQGVISNRLDPEDLQKVIRSFHQAVTSAVAPYEGHVAQLLGDARYDVA